MQLVIAVFIVVPTAVYSFDSQHIWHSSFLEAIPCEPGRRVGEWCEWDEWARCEYATCTRRRKRVCACPKPDDSDETLCPTILPQDDIRVGTRRTRKGYCNIPFFHGNRYYGDCSPIQGSEKCAVGSKGDLVSCFAEKGEMEEKDIGACDGWKLAQGWAQSKVMDKYMTVIGATSELGRQCYNPKIYRSGAGALENCVERYYYSRGGQRNTYSNLNNLAFSLDNCKFACAIDPKCEAIEFSEGYFCKIFAKFSSDGLKRELGTTLLTKPPNCIYPRTKRQEAQYPFRLAVKDLHYV